MNSSKEQKSYDISSLMSPDDILACLRSKEKTLAFANQNLFSEAFGQNENLDPLDKKLDHQKSLSDKTTNPESSILEHPADSLSNIDAQKASFKDIKKGILVTKKERSNWVSASPDKKYLDSPMKSPFFASYEDNSISPDSKEDESKMSFILDGSLEPKRSKKVTFIFDGQPSESAEPVISPQKVSLVTIRKKRAGRKTFSSEREGNFGMRNSNFKIEKSSPEITRPGSRQNYENLLSAKIESPLKVKYTNQEMINDISSNRGFISNNAVISEKSLTKVDPKDHFLDTKISEISPKKNSMIKLPSILSSTIIKPTHEASLSPEKSHIQKKEDSSRNRESINRLRTSLTSPNSTAFRYKGQTNFNSDRTKSKGDGSNIQKSSESKLKISFPNTLNKSIKRESNPNPIEAKDEPKKYSFIIHKRQQSEGTLVSAN